MIGGFYFARPSAFTDTAVILEGDEFKHAVKVMRAQAGDELQVIDGEGRWCRSAVTEIGKDRLVAHVIEEDTNVGEPGYNLTIGIAPPKRPARFEAFLEKAVELRVNKIISLESTRSERSRTNEQRVGRIMLAATKQSLRSRIPVLVGPTDLDQMLADATDDVRLIAHEGAPLESSIMALEAQLRTAESIAILIGPEGGFSPEEIERATDIGWRPVSLGSARLRTETAGIAAAGVIHAIKSY